MSVTDRTEAFLAKLDNVQACGAGWTARCPSKKHDDDRNSLSVNRGDDGRVLAHCHAGCFFRDIAEGAGFRVADLGPVASNGNGNGRHRSEIVATYDYMDAGGRLLYQVCRMAPKDFRQRRPDGKGGWVWNLQGVARVLYRLPEVLAAVERGDVVFIVEGEKDVERLRALGLTATCNAGGAGKWRAEYNEHLRGARVAVLPDNDPAGRKHGVDIGKGLQDVASSIKVIELPKLPAKGDVSDWLDAGGTVEALREIVEGAAVEGNGADDEVVEVVDDKGRVIPLGVAREVRRGRPHLVCVASDFYDFTGKVYDEIEPDEIDGDVVKLIGRKARRANLGDARHLLAVEARKPGDFFDQADPHIIHVQNGALNVATGELGPHDPKYRARNLLPVVYDPKADCSRFKRSMEQWQPDTAVRELLLEFIGYCLLPDVSQEKELFLVGDGGNGKGRFIFIVKTLLGPRNVSAVPLAALRADRTFPTAALVGKLVNIVPESEISRELDEGWIKSVVSGDPLEVERKGRDPFTFYNRARFIVQSNNPPVIRDKTDGWWRRLLVVRFGQTFTGAAVDTNLDAAHEAELPGILNLALEGLHRLSARGRFAPTPGMLAELDGYRQECNPLAAWREEQLVEAEPDWAGRAAWVSCADVYHDYRDWCRENGHTPYSRSKFTRELKRMGINQDTPKDPMGRTVKAFVGVELR